MQLTGMQTLGYRWPMSCNHAFPSFPSTIEPARQLRAQGESKRKKSGISSLFSLRPPFLAAGQASKKAKVSKEKEEENRIPQDIVFEALL